MKVKGKNFCTIWIKNGDRKTIQIIDQRSLPHDFIIEDLNTVDQVASAIREMHVRGAGLIGVTAGYGMYIAALQAISSDSFNKHMQLSANKLVATRPTAVNLKWAVERQLSAIQKGNNVIEKVDIAYKTALEISEEDKENCRRIGEYGFSLIKKIQKKKRGERINILTHCNDHIS